VRGARLSVIVDVRQFPGSRRYPHFAREAMTQWLGAAGLTYRWTQALGGRRRAVSESHNTALRHPAFRAYADYMETPPFREALEQVLADASEATAIMCSESLWWKCHRRLIADAAELLYHVPVMHLLHDGRLSPHRPTDGVRAAPPVLVYDGGQGALPW
jgi:uncharacterized protein (DUF488 family)